MSLVHRCAACVCSCGYVCSKVAMAVVGPVLATLATSLILFVVYVYFSHIYPTLTQASHGGLSLTSAQAYLVTLLGLWLLFVTLFHYAATMFLSPGYPPANTAYSPNLLAMLALDPELHSHSSLPYRYCRRCDSIKPLRTHHCAVCNRCVQRMDHRQSIHSRPAVGGYRDASTVTSLTCAHCCVCAMYGWLARLSVGEQLCGLPQLQALQPLLPLPRCDRLLLHGSRLASRRPSDAGPAQ